MWDESSWREEPGQPDEHAEIQRIFPRMSSAIIDAWLLHYYRNRHIDVEWPPPVDYLGMPAGRWAGLLYGRPMAYWQALTWKLLSIDLASAPFSAETRHGLAAC